MVRRHLRFYHGHAGAQVAVATLTHGAAQRRTSLPISDMVVSVAGSPIVHCVQTPTVRVANRPTTRPTTHVRILLLFPHHHQLMLTACTGRQGIVALNVQIELSAGTLPAADRRRGDRRDCTVTPRCTRLNQILTQGPRS